MCLEKAYPFNSFDLVWFSDPYINLIIHNSRKNKSTLFISFSAFKSLDNRFCEIVDAFYGSGSNVVQLTPNNFKSKVVNSNSVVLVEFYAPWCGHCKSLTPTWERAATILKGVATVAAIDADAHKAIAQEYGIQGFPTIKVFVPGKPPVDYQGARDAKPIAEFALKQEYGIQGFPTIKVFVPGKPHVDYQGARDAKPIAEFALKQVKALLKDRLSGKSTVKPEESSEKKSKSEPSASVELNSNNFDELVVKSKDVWMVEFFAPWCGHCKKLAPEWKKAAKNLQGKVKLGHVNCDDEKSLMSRYKVEGFPTILVFGADKESPLTYEGARTASAIESFGLVMLETNVAPPEVTELTSPDVMEEKCGSAAICFVAFLPDILDSKAEGRNKYLETLLSVAEKFKRDPYSYVWAAAGKQPGLENHIGVGGYGYPALIALNIKKGAYASLKSAFEQQQIIDARARDLTDRGMKLEIELCKTKPLREDASHLRDECQKLNSLRQLLSNQL
nr:protein disulfide isomerase-like 2-3 [Tanacetum cinerariifolium]